MQIAAPMSWCGSKCVPRIGMLAKPATIGTKNPKSPARAAPICADAVVPDRPREHDRKDHGKDERPPHAPSEMRQIGCAAVRGMPTGTIISMPIVIVIATSTIGE